MRGLIVLVFVIGFTATMVAHVASQSKGQAASRASAVTQAADSSERGRAAEPSAPQFSSDDSSITLDRDSEGHFYADVRINGNPVDPLGYL